MKGLKLLLHSLILTAGILAGALLLLPLTGTSSYIVLSGSMEPAVPTGSLCLLNTRAAYSRIEEGDIIAFAVSGETMAAHRVIRVTEEGMETKGDANEYSDGIRVREDNFRGKVVFTIPYAGRLIRPLQSKKGRILGFTGLLACFLINLLLPEQPGWKGEPYEKH